MRPALHAVRPILAAARSRLPRDPAPPLAFVRAPPHGPPCAHSNPIQVLLTTSRYTLTSAMFMGYGIGRSKGPVIVDR